MSEEWSQRWLADVVGLQRGFDLPEHSRRAGTVPVLGSFGVTGNHDTAKVRGPGVTIGRSGVSIGVATYTTEDYWPLNTTLYVKDFKGNNPRFIYFLLKSMDFTAFNSGSAQPSLNRNYIANMPVSLPPPHQQAAIVEVLGALDDTIEANQRIIDLAEELAVLVSQQAPQRLPLETLAVVERKQVRVEAFAQRMVDHFSLPAFDNGALPDRCDGSTIMSNKFVVGDASVLVSKLNPHIPRIWHAVPHPGVEAVASTEFVILRSTTDASSEELWAACASPSFVAGLQENVTGTTGSHQRVRPEDVMRTEVHDPRALAENSRDVIKRLVRIAGVTREESARTAELRDALLPRMLSGEIHVLDVQALVGEAV